MARILIAEDDPEVREYLYDELTHSGFMVTAVENGAEAVVAAAETAYDLFLLDMLMPGLDGVQTIKVLRKVTPGTPIVGLTGYLGRGFMAEAANYGVTCLSKPIDVDDLLDEINEHLSN